MRFLTTMMTACVLTVAMTQSAIADENSFNVNNLPLNDRPTGECADYKVKPDWFYEGYDVVPQRWRHGLRDSFYILKRYETIIEAGRCTCADRFPDPEQWRGDIEALVDQYRDNPSEAMRETSRLINERTPLSIEVVKICRDN